MKTRGGVGCYTVQKQEKKADMAADIFSVLSLISDLIITHVIGEGTTSLNCARRAAFTVR